MKKKYVYDPADYQKNREAILKRQLKYNKKHRAERRAYSRQHYKDNPDYYRKKNAARYPAKVTSSEKGKME